MHARVSDFLKFSEFERCTVCCGLKFERWTAKNSVQRSNSANFRKVRFARMHVWCTPVLKH